MDATGPSGQGGSAELGRISLTGIAAMGRHGVLESERELGQPFVVDVDLDVHMDTRGDELSGTVNYAQVARLVVDEIEGVPAQLVETLARRIADRCLVLDGRVAAATVCVHKPQAPVGVVLTDVAVTIRRERHDVD